MSDCFSKSNPRHHFNSAYIASKIIYDYMCGPLLDKAEDEPHPRHLVAAAQSILGQLEVIGAGRAASIFLDTLKRYNLENGLALTASFSLLQDGSYSLRLAEIPNLNANSVILTANKDGTIEIGFSPKVKCEMIDISTN